MRYIFRIDIKKGATVEQYTEAWKKGSQLIQTYPGARGTRLVSMVGEPNVLLAIAEWDSLAARVAAMTALGHADSETQKIWLEHRNFADISIIGAFDDTEWAVMPA